MLAVGGGPESIDWVCFEMPYYKSVPDRWVCEVEAAVRDLRVHSDYYILLSCVRFLFKFGENRRQLEPLITELFNLATGCPNFELAYKIASSLDWRMSEDFRQGVLRAFGRLPKWYRSILWIDSYVRATVTYAKSATRT